MLTLADIIRAPKSEIDIGPWKSGKIPSSAFPLTKQKRLHLNSAWQWRVVTFDALGKSFRLLIRLNNEINYYSSILAIDSTDQIQIICHHEIHISHRNWHCHFVPGDVTDTLPGVLRDSERMRVYEAQPSQAASAHFNVEPPIALAIASARFRFPAPDETPDQLSLL